MVRPGTRLTPVGRASEPCTPFCTLRRHQLGPRGTTEVLVYPRILGLPRLPVRHGRIMHHPRFGQLHPPSNPGCDTVNPGMEMNAEARTANRSLPPKLPRHHHDGWPPPGNIGVSPAIRLLVRVVHVVLFVRLAGETPALPGSRNRALLQGQSVLTFANPAFTGFSSM